jgi:intracellular multiplication protein IcmO
MPLLLQKYRVPHRNLLRDVRPASVRIAETMQDQSMYAGIALTVAVLFLANAGDFALFGDIAALVAALYFRWAIKRPLKLALKFPKYANLPDPNNTPPGKGTPGKSEGILYLGNADDPEETTYRNELWLTNNDARTHILYLGTTGSGKTEGLKGLVTNSLAWGSGYVYVDGKADTDLWASLYAVARRFGRDDDVFILNYMTGNSDDGSLSNSMNPFSNGSSSYLANMITNFMPDAGGDNAMWKERAVALMFALLPALVYKRDHQGLLLDIGVVRDNIEMQPIIRLARDHSIPERITHGLQGYLNTLPGFVDAAFDDEGNERPPSPDQPMYDLQVARQQHGYLSMQFTRSLQMLADEYGYIFKAQLADIEMLDVVLNRRILITLIPALEKAGEEAANLGKIVAATLKGMMGMTLGNSVEGGWEDTIGSKQTRSASSFMTVFDEVGYYTAQGMAVMAAQARSLGFSLVFASQDLPAMEKRIKTEAKSIIGNCNLKIYGRIEDPTDTMDFIGKHTQNDYVMETTSMKAPTTTIASLFLNTPFYDDRSAKIEKRIKFDGDMLKQQREGEVHYTFAELFGKGRMFYVDPGKVGALRVQRLLPVPGTTSSTAARERAMTELVSKMRDPEWQAGAGLSPAVTSNEIAAMAKGASLATTPIEAGIFAIANLEGVPVSKTAIAADSDARPAANIAAPGSPAQAQAAMPRAQGGTQGGGAPQGAVTMPRGTEGLAGISPQEKAAQRTGMPPFYEGDQYAIENVEAAPAGWSMVSGANAPQNGKPQNGQQGAQDQHIDTGIDYTGTEADFRVVTPASNEEDNGTVMDVKLGDDVVALLEQSAKKLNKGLAGSGEVRG